MHLVAFASGPIRELQRDRIEQICDSVRAVPQRSAALRTTDRIASLWHGEPASVRASWSPEFAAQVGERAAAVRPDLVIAFELGVAPYAFLVKGVPRVLEELEVAYMLEQYTKQPYGWRRMRAWLTWAKHRQYLTRLLKRFDACTVVSSRECDLARPFLPATVDLAVIPNGTNVEAGLGRWGDPEPDTLIYPGALSFAANRDAMVWFTHACLPLIQERRPQVRLRITGQASQELSAGLRLGRNVELTGYLPDVRPLVARSWCEVVPLRVGGGTRLKVLEALALGTPVVSTSKGVEGLNLEPGRDVLCADTPADFARVTAELLSDPARRARLAAAGQRIVREYYDWRAISQRLDDLLHETVSRGRRRVVCQIPT
jgi:glycosyltransferase involved in cell wall biosynthesis